MHKRISLYLSSLALLLLLSMPKKCLAQFTYIGGGLSYQFLKIHKGDLRMYNGTRVSSFNFNIGVICRPIRNLGLGLNLSTPIYQHHHFGFSGAKLSDGELFAGYVQKGYNSVSNASKYFGPNKYDYTFKIKPKATFLVRFYMTTQSNFYVSFRASATTIDEEFIFKRSYKISFQYDPATEENIDYTEKHQFFAPGFGLGFSPHLSNHLFMDMSFDMDFYNFDGTTFSYPISYDEIGGYGIINMNFTSQAIGTKVAINFKFGLGYYF